MATLRRLCLIPGRAGSKGVPGKNVAVVAGETLAARATRCAVQAGVFDRIVATTDDPILAAEVVKAGGEAPFMRPDDLASDAAPVILALQHAWTWLARQDGFAADLVVLLEPTSPLRSPAIVRELVARVEAAGADSGQTLSLVPDNYRPVKQMNLAADGLTSDVMPMPPGVVRRQDLPPTYIRNGMAYVMTRGCLMDLGKIIGPRNVGLVVVGPAVNIDWPEDLEQVRRQLET